MLKPVTRDRLLSFCAQTVVLYIISTKRKRKFNENQENNTLGKYKQLSQEKSHTLDSKRLTDVLVVAWADLYPFAVQTSVNRLLSASCPPVRLLSEIICCVLLSMNGLNNDSPYPPWSSLRSGLTETLHWKKQEKCKTRYGIVIYTTWIENLLP